MKTPLRLLFAALSLAVTFPLHAGSPDYKPELFQSTKLVYEDHFDDTLSTDFWEVRQNTTWAVKDGVLHGSESSKEFQEKKKASDDPSHAGLKPVIWLKRCLRTSSEPCACATTAKPIKKAFLSSISAITSTRSASPRRL